MKPWVRHSAVIIFLVAVLGGYAVWHAAFRMPSVDLQPLPSTLIPVESQAGQRLLAEAGLTADYEVLWRNFEAQSRRGFCGVASSVVVLNALGAQPRLTQATFFTEATDAVRSSLQVTFAGMTLAELGGLLQAHGAEVTIEHAAASSLAEFRNVLQQNLATAGDFLLVNYDRAGVGEEAMGHISPLAAYNAEADLLLILDVAAYKYPPVWVAPEQLWNAMNTLDTTSGLTRGYAVVSGSP